MRSDADSPVVLHIKTGKRTSMSQVNDEWNGDGGMVHHLWSMAMMVHGLAPRSRGKLSASGWPGPPDTNWGVLGPARDVFDGRRKGPSAGCRWTNSVASWGHN